MSRIDHSPVNSVKKTAAPPENVPLLTLVPVVNDRHAWAALLLRAQSADNSAWLAALPRIFGEFELNSALANLDAIVCVEEPHLLSGEIVAALPAAKLVLLLPLAYCADPARVELLSQLRQCGFRLMADGLPAAGVTLPPAVTAVTSDGGALAAAAHLPGPHLAQGVDDASGLERCKNAGYRWFAGDYPLHPQQTKRQQTGSSRTLLLRLLAMVAADADSHEIETLLKQDSSLSYHLLKLVNSVSFALTTTITSFSYAITLLGRRQLQRWLQLLLYAQQKHGDDASPLLARAARRAAMMEELCKLAGGGKEDQDHAFMAGMFSLLDALFSMPLEKIVTPLHLSDDIEAGLLSRGGWLGSLLSLVEQSERKPSAELASQVQALLLTPADYLRAQVQASAWAIQVSRDT